jgi:hypothetical protein
LVGADGAGATGGAGGEASSVVGGEGGEARSQLTPGRVDSAASAEASFTQNPNPLREHQTQLEPSSSVAARHESSSRADNVQVNCPATADRSTRRSKDRLKTVSGIDLIGTSPFDNCTILLEVFVTCQAGSTRRRLMRVITVCVTHELDPYCRLFPARVRKHTDARLLSRTLTYVTIEFA